MAKLYNVISQLKTGDRVIVPKSVFNLVQHHAIYLGIENGIHYLIENKESIGVRVVTAELFFYGVKQITRIEYFTPTINYSRPQLLKLALSKVGARYHLTNYNCEHFANEVQYGRSGSQQVNNFEKIATLAVSLLMVVGLFSGNK